MRPLRSNDPREVAGYVLRGRLGQGGQGTVFLGTSPSGQQAAVKLLHAPFGHDPDARRHFHRELAALQRVAPFCTARVLGADPDADPPYVISEYIDGPSLQDAVRDNGLLGGADLDRLAIATATALGAIHAAGVVHRDFKPANVLLAADGPRVIDFGIARPIDATAATVSGVVGTPAYMSPEQLSGHPAGPPLDMFAWGCTMAFAANGRPPFGHEPLPAVINRILNAEPDLGLLTGTLRGFVAACLHKDPSWRPTARQVLLGLMNKQPGPPSYGTPFPASHGTSPSQGTPPAPRQGPWPVTPQPATPTPTQPGRARGGMIAGAVLAGALVIALTVTAAVAITRDWTPQTPTSPSPSATSPTETASTTATPTPSPAAQVARSPRLGLEFWQDNVAGPMAISDLDRPVTTVTMKRRPFELRFPTLPKDTAAQVCAWTDDSVFSVDDGGKVADHPCFKPGTGIADYEHGSGTLYLNNRGHNYLIGDRVGHSSASQDSVLFSTVFKDGASTLLAAQQKDLYLTVFIDLDGDGTFKRASPGEYEYVILHFSG
ncbi:serine/threonine-protein kinase [Nonomuraea sp. NPDC049750]|uniref:serine/threonine protein kinase n=1 Tax=Nonomuraea sp. NPDC049750 TaxID=3154738 RepID=UPI0033F52EBD